MTNETRTHIDQLNERLRQEKLLFEQRRQQQKILFNQRILHEKRWFQLRLVMACLTIPMLIAVMWVSCHILLHNSTFPDRVVTCACMAFFTDVLGLLLAIWKIVLNPKFESGTSLAVNQVPPEAPEEGSKVRLPAQ